MRKYIVSVLLITGVVSVAIMCNDPGSKKTEALVSAVKQVTADTSCSCVNSFNKIVYGLTIPGDAASTNGQPDFNCFAWAEFVALNWPTDSGAGFGDPRDLSPVQWETFIQKESLYLPDGAVPQPWNAQNQNSKSEITSLLKTKAPANTKMLRFSTKFTTTGISFNDSIPESNQAASPNGISWLGAQNSTNVWYEVLLNEDIYNYVVQNKYYNAQNQADSANKGTPINFPAGVVNGITGAIELKAAWMEVNDLQNPKWNRYKLSNAIVTDLNTGNPRQVVVALVGLHILHKTASQPSWVWTTFEQIDNVPSPGDSANKLYNFYDSTGLDSVNQPHTYHLVNGGSKPTPNCVTRVTAISSTAMATNKNLQAQIRSIYPNSVWQYYQMVNVIWQNNGPGVTDTTSVLPFPFTSPGGTYTSNTTMETYVQNLTCVNCHTFASIAPTATSEPAYFSDFSFAIGSATAPAASLRKRAKKSNFRMIRINLPKK
ncbi:MAG: hypothetical protein QM737_07860 [Ferruginibacter sp.]